MKSFVFILLFLSGLSVSSQEWFQPDDLWTYTYFEPFATEGYMEMRPLRDTIVNGQMAVIMEEDYVAINQETNDSVFFKRNPIVYELDKQVYILDDRRGFTILYDFNLDVGDSIVYDIHVQNLIPEFKLQMQLLLVN